MLMISDSSIIWGESICMFETDLSNQLISYIVSLEIFSDSSIIWRESICRHCPKFCVNGNRIQL